MEIIKILNEIKLEDCTFNLKSQTTGKYSIHDSYRENYASGFLQKIDAPADVNNALKDIYYATEKGLVISYKEFNTKILLARKELIAKNYPGQDVKNLSRDERIKLETDSAKKVLKDLQISENTKLFYSPEITNLLENYENEEVEVKTKFIIKETKVVFYKEKEAKETPEEKEKREKLVKQFLDFSDMVKPLVEKALLTYNLDDLELTLLALDNTYNNLPDFIKENEDINKLYGELRDKLNKEITLMKQRQVEFEKTVTKLVDDLISNKHFKKIKEVISKLETKFKENNYLKNDTKANSIKEVAIERLKNSAKVIALVSLKDWTDVNFKTCEAMLKENLSLELENLLIKKRDAEHHKRTVIEEKLLQMDVKDINHIYDKFLELSPKKDLVTKFFEILTEKGFEDLNFVVTNLKDKAKDFIVLLANKVHFDKFKAFWSELPFEFLESLTSSEFNYELFSKSKVKDLYFEALVIHGTQEVIEDTFYKIKKHTFKNISTEVMSKILLKLRFFNFELEKQVKLLSPTKLIFLIKDKELNDDNYIRNSILRSLGKWMPILKVDSPEFKEMLINYPEYGIYNLRKQQARTLSSELLLEVLENLKNQDDVQQFLLRTGKDKYEEAMKSRFTDLVQKDPSFENHFNLAISLLTSKDYEGAVLEFKRCLGLNPENHLAHFNLGLTYELQGKYDMAMQAYKKASQIKYNYVEAMYNLGLIYTKLKDYFLALQQFKKIIKIDPENYDTCMSMGVCYDEMGEFDNAINEYEKAISINPNKVDAYINKAICLSVKGDTFAAIDLYNQIINKDPENPTIQYNLALLYQKLEEYVMASLHYKLSLRYEENNSQAYNNLGLIYFLQDKKEKAFKAWQRAIELDNNIDAYNNLGWGYGHESRFEEAIEIYLKAKKINPKHTVLYMNLATVYYRSGQLNKAIEELEHYLELEPNSENSFEVIKILKSMRVFSKELEP